MPSNANQKNNDEISMIKYRATVGPPENYDLMGAFVFNLLTFLGLRESHKLLDIGCGSLRGGRLFIIYLLTGNYYGIEPQQWLIDDGINNELSKQLVENKQPHFSNDDNFNLSLFNEQFDYILAQSIFSHASESQIRKSMREAKKVMKPESVFVATFFIGEENYEGDEWVYPGRTTYTMEKMTQMIEEEGLICKKTNWPHPHGQTWIAVLMKSAPGNVLKAVDGIFGGTNQLLDNTGKWLKEKNMKIQNENQKLKKENSQLQNMLKNSKLNITKQNTLLAKFFSMSYSISSRICDVLSFKKKNNKS
ncbi:MAG: class I SAM-dependent methyltransferase [Spirochaetota bacterium]|nr:class I SAM-dependent methyltransferase [Spirochaetota bacterium]